MIETGGHGWMGAPATGTSVAGKYTVTQCTHTHTVPPHVACNLSQLLQGSSGQWKGEGPALLPVLRPN